MAKHQFGLFPRLLLYFSVIMLLPILILAGYYYLVAQDSFAASLSEQSGEMLEKDGLIISDILEKYRHKAYTISTSPEVISLLSAESQERREVYSQMFTTMAGDTYKASASVISSDGKIRLSTHIFPDEYDVRIHGNEWDTGNILTEAWTRKYDKRSTLIYAGDHRLTDEKYQVFASLLRYVFTPAGDTLGYVIIDIFTDAVVPYLSGSSIFQEEILLDNNTFIAFSLLHPNLWGPMSKFPSLTAPDSLVNRYDIGGFTLIAITDYKVFNSSATSLLFGAAVALAIGFVFAVVCAFFFSLSMTSRIKKMRKSMKRIQEGDLDLKLEEETGISDFNELCGSFNSMVSRIIELLQSQAEEKERTAVAERKALESQLDPHFIFNTLSTIKALARLHGEEEIYLISLKLGKILRSSLKNREPECTLEESCELTDSYLQIQKIRFRDKLSYSIFIDEEAKKIKTPKLIIQPLAENALVHGIEPMGEAGCVSIKVALEGKEVVIAVEDTGLGCDDSIFQDLDKLSEEGHVGIANIYHRLLLRYGKDFSFTLKSVPGKGTSAIIKIVYEGNADLGPGRG